ncbi:MAG: type II toxin-antitoxin system prevent-host-death family antitoxin [Planctomycetota bacterium]|nr:type II toxin-antitoxin system prevent-host-death family antitoxin [Planctomycetota bacterium]
MLVDTNRMVPSSKLRAKLPKYLREAEAGEAICVTHNGKVAGFLIGAREYEALQAEEISRLLVSRKGEPGYSQEAAMRRVRKAIKRAAVRGQRKRKRA